MFFGRIGRLFRHPHQIVPAVRARLSRRTAPGETLRSIQAPGVATGDDSLVSVIIPWSRGTQAELEAMAADIFADPVVSRSEILVCVFASSINDDVPILSDIPGVRLTVGDRADSWASAANEGLHCSAGSVVVVLGEALTPEPGWLGALLERLTSSAALAQSLIIASNGLIANAGTVRVTPLASPVDFLAGHPVEEIVDLESFETPFVSVPAFAARRGELGGFDSSLSCRGAILMASAGIDCGAQVVAAGSRLHGSLEELGDVSRQNLLALGARGPVGETADADYARVGLRLVGARSLEPTRREMVRRVIPHLARIEQRPERLRWAIRIGAPVGKDGDLWGDTMFATDLAAALRRLGQHVIVDRLDNFARPSSDYLDDVCLTVHGLYALPLNPTALNVLWVISHPSWVDRDELRSGYGLVYAASEAWAASEGARSGISVKPLLQATASDRFFPGESDPLSATDVLFVGRSRDVYRPIVRHSIEMGLPLAVYGDGWEQFIDAAKYVRASSLSPSMVPGAYRSARFVLNDHWEDMARLGFVSNRIFDAVASGARVITDEIGGLTELFGSSVQAYRTAEDLARLVSEPAHWPSGGELRDNAEQVRAKHSFDSRAKVILDDVMVKRATVGSG